MERQGKKLEVKELLKEIKSDLSASRKNLKESHLKEVGKLESDVQNLCDVEDELDADEESIKEFSQNVAKLEAKAREKAALRFA